MLPYNNIMPNKLMKFLVKRFIPAFCFSIFGLTAHAQTQLFGSTGLDPSFCQEKTFRQTIVYVDILSLQQGKTAWAIDLEGKLKATLTPGERVTVVELLPNNGT